MKGFVRPKATILDEGAVVPDENLISPAPNQFTHELTRSQPFYFKGAAQADAPDGELPAGTKVVLLTDEGNGYCRVVDGQGLCVEVKCGSLKKL